MQKGYLLTDTNFTSFNFNGVINSFGKVYVTNSNDGQPATTYQDSNLTIPNTNPVVLDASGKADIYLAVGYYDITVTDSDDIALWTTDKLNIEEFFSKEDNKEVTYKVNTTDELLSISGMQTDDVCIVSDYQEGGTFVYDENKTTVNNNLTIFNGWVLQGQLILDTVDDFADLTSADDGRVTFVRDVNRGGYFVYDSSKIGEDNDGTNFIGNVRQYEGAVNVKWFGARWDRSDNEVPIQKALDFANNVEFGSIEGESYTVSSSIYYKSRQVIDFKQCSLILDTSIKDGAYNVLAPKEGVTVNDVIIMNGKIDGGVRNEYNTFTVYPTQDDDFNHSGVSCISVFKSKRVVVKNMILKQSYYGIEIKASQDILIENCSAYDCSDDGFSISDKSKQIDVDSKDPNRSSNIVFNKCEAYNNGHKLDDSGHSGFEVDDGPENVTFNSCRAYSNVHRGFDVHTHIANALHEVDNVTFNDCIAENNNLPVGYDTPDFDGYNVGFNLNAPQGNGFTLNGCVSMGHKASELLVISLASLHSTSMFHARNVKVINCTFDGSSIPEYTGTSYYTQYVVKLQGFKDTTFSGNTIKAPRGVYGIQGTHNYDITLSNNTIYHYGRVVYISAPTSTDLDSGRFEPEDILNISAKVTGNIFTSVEADNSGTTNYRPIRFNNFKSVKFCDNSIYYKKPTTNLSGRSLIDFGVDTLDISFDKNIIEADTQLTDSFTAILQVYDGSGFVKVHNNLFKRCHRVTAIAAGVDYRGFTGNTSFENKEYLDDNGEENWGNGDTPFTYEAGNEFIDSIS